MAYDASISRSSVEALIPEVVSREIIQGVPEQSVVMRLARRLPNMSTNKTRMPVLSGLVQAYFVDSDNGYGDSGLKQTTNATWSNKFIEAGELAVLVPIPESVLDDTSYDIWGEIRPRIVEAFGIAFDRAVLYGESAPSIWPTNVLAAAVAAGHSVTDGTGADLYEDVFGENGLMGFVEDDGFDVTGHVGVMRMKRRFRGLRDADGGLLFMRTPQTATAYELDGSPMDFPKNGAMDATKALLISGDWQQLVWSMRQDVTYKILDQAVITDASGQIIFNLAQQDMVALRAVIRLGWQLPNPINRLQPTEASRYPFAVLVP